MRILVVEDEREISDFIKKMLLQDGHAVDVAADGDSAEQLACSESYDLLILDIMLPLRDGLAVLESLRAEGISTPVLMLTARGEVSDRVSGLDAGADDYLVKPFAVAELRARVRALLRRNAPDHSARLTCGPLLLDTVARRITLADKEVELTSREFAILEYLLHNKGRLLSKGMIAEHVWDYHFDSDYNLIEVYMRRLRQKLEPAFPGKLIHTVRNGGYMLKEPLE